jgi:hypothetical protein
MVEAYVKILRTGLLCLTLLWTSGSVRAQAQRDAAGEDQQAPAAQPPAAQQPPAQQPPAEAPAPPQPESQRVRLPPPPPKVVDVRMPGESGYYIGITGWLPVGQSFIDKGRTANFTDPSKLQFAGSSKGAFGAEIGLAAGIHNSLRASYFQAKQGGSTVAPHEMVIFTQTYAAGDQLSTSSKLTNLKLSYEYLTWPYPVEARHLRLKTLWQVQYVSMDGVFDAPIRSATETSTGGFVSYASRGAKSFITPAIGLGIQEYATRNFRFEANISGFTLPHRFQLLDSDVTLAYRAGRLEFRAGAKGFLFRTSPKTDFFYRGTIGGAFVGLRWYSD